MINSSTTAPSPAAPKPEIHREMDSLTKSLEGLYQTIASLENELAPVLHPGPEGAEESPPSPTSSPIGSQLHTNTRSAEACTGRLNRLIARLAV